MKKLYENIEDIHIIGDISQLTEVVTAIDNSMQSIALGTENIFGLIVRYSASNKGLQYEKVVKTVTALRDEIYNVSVGLNQMQNEVVAYQNKVYRYEGMLQAEAAPNPHIVEKSNISVDTTVVKFQRSELLEVIEGLRNYSEAVYFCLREIIQKKEEMGAIWLDTQYRDFSEVIDEVTNHALEALKIFDEYVVYANEKIQELN